MRETRLYDYGNIHNSDRFSSGDIAFTTSDFDQLSFTPGTWAGLINGTVAWRVEEGDELIFENILTRKGLRLKLSSPLTCRPLLCASTADSLKLVEVLVSCYTSKVGCILLRIRITIPPTDLSAAITYEEICRQAIPATCITCMADVDGDPVIGRSDGSCAVVKFSDGASPRMNLIPFAPSAIGDSENQGTGDDTSMVSGGSDESAPSHRSVASSMSFGLMTRLFGSPRGTPNVAARNAVEADSHEPRHTISSARRPREEKMSYRKTMDKVICVTKVTLDVKALMSLHQSGRLCVFVATDASYKYVNDMVLPVKLSAGLANHFLMTGPNESIIAAVVADEDPHADSLRIYSVAAKVRGERAIGLSATQIAMRRGPVDRIVSASFIGEDVIIGSESGFVSGVLNVPSDLDDGTGIPTGTLWTALDDMEQPFGLSSIVDAAHPDPRDHLLQAHRFSVSAVAKALRMENPGLATRAQIAETVRTTVFDQDGENMWNRVKARAEHITKSEDLLVRDLCMVGGVGLVVARQRSLSVMRGLLEFEQKAVENRAHLLLNREAVTSPAVGWMLSSHAACQVTASRYALENNNADAKNEFKFMLSTATCFSSVDTDDPLLDRSARRCGLGLEGDLEFSNLGSAIMSSLSVIEPGVPLVLLLQSLAEMDLLLVAAEQASNALPVSSMFASGMSWLLKSGSAAYALVDSWIDKTAAVVHRPEQTDWRTEKAYRFFITASQWCSKESVPEADIRCAAKLASVTPEEVMLTEKIDAQEDVVMAGDGRDLKGDLDIVQFRKRLGFWLLERAVRMFETNAAPKSAAAASLEAMDCAPDRKRHEMMRASAFTRFLDAGNLEYALIAILRDPYEGEHDSDFSIQESTALRDAVGLFVDAVADAGRLQWLADCKLPAPLSVLCGLALERRARAADALNLRHITRAVNFPESSEPSMAVDESQSVTKEVKKYEQLYSWHVLHDDMASAATSALEWGERLSDEGLSTIRNAVSNDSARLSVDQQMRLLLEWTKAKCEAWAYALSATQLESPERRYIARSRFSLLADRSQSRKGIVSESWVSRRHLLAHAQGRVLTAMLSEGESNDTRMQFFQFVVSPDSVLLLPQAEGLRWVTSMLLHNRPSYDNVLLCAELGSAWREEVGESLLVDVVREAANRASQQSITSFGYAELDELLRAVVSTGGKLETSRNWNLIALESALATSAGAVACPQWLVDAAAWGSASFAEGTTVTERLFSGRKRGDAAGVVRALLRHHRPVDAAKVLIVGLRSQGRATGSSGNKGVIYVPYSAIDATMEMLAQCADDYPDAEVYRRQLEACTMTHISKMEEQTQNRNPELMDVVA